MDGCIMNKKFIVYLIAGSFLLSGCGSSVFFKKIIFGSSLSDFNTANTKREQTFSLSAEECYKRSIDFFTKVDAHISTADAAQGFIVAVRFENFFSSCIDSTEVAVVVTSSKEAGSTVRVMSYNTDLANAVADSLYIDIQKPAAKVARKLTPRLELPQSKVPGKL